MFVKYLTINWYNVWIKEEHCFRVVRSCMDNVYTLNEIVQGRVRDDKQMYSCFLDVQKVYDTEWCDGLWLKLWDMGVNRRMCMACN